MHQRDGTPLLAPGSHILPGDPAAPIVVSGRVGDPNGRPIAGATIEVWQVPETGLHDAPGAPPEERDSPGRFMADAVGRYSFPTVLGHRPGLIHFRLSAPGYQDLVATLYIADIPRVEPDAVFAVSKALLIAAQPRICYNFVLAPATAASAPS